LTGITGLDLIYMILECTGSSSLGICPSPRESGIRHLLFQGCPTLIQTLTKNE